MEDLNFINQGPSLQVRAFYPSDTEELFKINSDTQPADWLYHNNPIEYSLNSQGYRAPEFNTVDWINSIVIFGCSNVFGIGLHQHDTVSAQLSRMVNRPVVNMGFGGSSIEVALYNSGVLRHSYPRPFAVVHAWTMFNRCTEFIDNGLARHHGAHSTSLYDANYFMTLNKTDTNQATRARYQKTLAEGMWKETGVRYFDCSFFHSTSQLLDCAWIKAVDYARDVGSGHDKTVGHPGRQSAHGAAWTIAQGLGLKN
jgi:hypothetical protein